MQTFGNLWLHNLGRNNLPKFCKRNCHSLDWCITATEKSLQSCPTLCNPRDGSPPGSPVPGTLQARTLEWVAISFSNAGKWKVKGKSLSRVRLLVTPWTAAYQVLPSMGFSRQEYWSGMPLPSPRLMWGPSTFKESMIIRNHSCKWSAYRKCEVNLNIFKQQGCLYDTDVKIKFGTWVSIVSIYSRRHGLSFAGSKKMN